MTMDRLGDMRLFVEAAAAGSLSAAGRKLGLSPAAASARLVKLEKSLHARLFERTTRQLRVTDEGRLYLQHCRIALQAIDDAEAALQAGQNRRARQGAHFRDVGFRALSAARLARRIQRALSRREFRADAVRFGVEPAAGGNRSRDPLRRAARQRSRRAATGAEPARAVRVAGLSGAATARPPRPPISKATIRRRSSRRRGR